MQETRFGHAACLLSDGRVLISGGSQFPGEKTLESTEIYDPATETFTGGPVMSQERSRHTATRLLDGRVLITGGNSITAKGQLADTELYDPAAGTFSPGPEMAEARMDHTATLLPDGRVLITGGFNGAGEHHTVASCDVYDPATNSISPTDPLPYPVHEQKATLIAEDAVLVSGGLVVKGQKQGAVPILVLVEP